jgi:hypothetical protein
MVHRGLPEHGSWWRLGHDLVVLAILAAVFSVVFIAGDLLLYGHVHW